MPTQNNPWPANTFLRRISASLLLGVFLTSCWGGPKTSTSADDAWKKANPDILPAIPYAMDSSPVVLRGAKIYTAAGEVLASGDILMAKGRIQQVSPTPIAPPPSAQIIEAKGLVATPGLIDVHSHMGVYPYPSVDAHADGNEMVRPVTADVWAEHGFWPQDPALWRALAGGVTTIQVLPGSGNLFGGRSFTAKILPKKSAREMRFPGAPQGLKMACGENPKRVYNKKNLMTRMGNVAGYRKAFQEALEYRRTLQDGAGSEGKVPKRNFVSETLAQVLAGEILIHFHCYRADDISAILDVAKEFGFQIRTVHHGLEAYKVADRLAQEGVATATWADWWGFKAEAFDGIPQNAALLHQAGARAIIHSDSATDIRFLNVETGKAMVAGHQVGLKISEDDALAWVTKNAAWALGLEKEIGTLEAGKMADVVLWDGHPFSVYSKTKMVFINGKKVFDREKNLRPHSDFETGYGSDSLADGRDFAPPEPPLEMDFHLITPEKISQNPPPNNNSFQVKNARAFIRGQWRDNQTITVTDGVITSLDADADAKDHYSFDGQNRPVTPGFVQANSSVGLVDIALDTMAQDLYEGNGFHPENNPLWSFNPESERVPLAAAQGVLTQISRPRGGMISGQGVAFDNRWPATPAQARSVGMFASLKPFAGKEHTSTRTTNWSLFRTLVAETALLIKNPSLLSTGRSTLITNPLTKLEAFVPVLKGQTPLVIKMNRAQDMRNLIRLKTEINNQWGFSLRPVVHGGAEAWKLGSLLAQHNIPVLLTPSLQVPDSLDKVHSRFDLAAALDKQGVTILLDDDTDHGVFRLRQEAGFAAKYGLSPEKALTAITETPATTFGLSRGALKLGAPANMTLWSSDPLEPTSVAQRVWVDGRLVSLRHRQRQLAEKYLKK